MAFHLLFMLSRPFAFFLFFPSSRLFQLSSHRTLHVSVVSRRGRLTSRSSHVSRLTSSQARLIALSSHVFSSDELVSSLPSPPSRRLAVSRRLLRSRHSATPPPLTTTATPPLLRHSTTLLSAITHHHHHHYSPPPLLTTTTTHHHHYSPPLPLLTTTITTHHHYSPPPPPPPPPHPTMYPHPAPETFLLDNNAHRALPQDAVVALQQVDNLKYFLISAPVDWSPDQYIRRFLLPTGEYVSCVLWGNLFHISGTDVVRCLAFRFHAFGRPVRHAKKFEEGIFSDLRNLKAGTDASLEDPKSPFLDFLYKNNAIRTQKKQKVFFWYSVPHDRLFLDALERDLKREKMGHEPTTNAVAEPALSFQFDSSHSLFEQLTRAQHASSSAAAAAAAAAAPPPNLSAAAPPDLSAAVAPPDLSAMPPPPPPPADDYSYALGAGDHPPPDPHPYIPPPAPLRHSSMPTYMEYSPAPSFVSSHWDEYNSQRALSYEPLTPPQHHPASANVDTAYVAPDDPAALYAMPPQPPYHMLAPHPPSHNHHHHHHHHHLSSAPPSYPAVARHHSTATSHDSTWESPPTDKSSSSLPRRRSSLAPSPYPAHPPSRLRRSLPRADLDHEDSSLDRRTTRRGTLPADAEDDNDAAADRQSMPPPPPLDDAAPRSPAGGPVRRARSATHDRGPYAIKSHSCPIPMCGRLFKRMEHLKRHVRTHTQERPYVCPLCHKAFSRSDNLAQHRRTHEAHPDRPASSEDELDDAPRDDDAAAEGAGDASPPLHAPAPAPSWDPRSMAPPPHPVHHPALVAGSYA